LLEGALRGERPELVATVRNLLLSDRRADEALCDEIRIASVGRRRMRVLADGETEVSDDGLPREARDVLAASHQLDDRQREIGEAKGVGRAALEQERVQRGRVRRARELLAEAGGERDDALPAFGRADDAAQNGESLRLQEAGNAPVGRDHEVLDQ